MGRVTITLKGKKKPIPEPKKGPILPTDTPEYLPRRGSLIRFFDGGQTAELVTNDFVKLPTIGPSVFGMAATGNFLTFSDVQGITDEILGIENFTTEFRKIVKSRDFSFNIYIRGVDSASAVFTYSMLTSYPNWSEGGIRLPSHQLEGSSLLITDDVPVITEYVPGDHFVPLELHDRAVTKVTNEPVYTADAVDFQLKNGDSICLIPAINISIGQSRADRVDGAVTYEEAIGLNTIYCIKPRTDNPDDRYLAFPITDPAVFDQVQDFCEAIAGSRTATTRFGYSDLRPDEFVLGGTFPATPSNNASLPVVGFTLFPSFTNQLVGIVKRGSTYFYFWELAGI